MGKIFFYILWPLVWFYAPLRSRACANIRVGDEFLLVKNGFGPRIWQFPGGGIKSSEHPIDAAIREVAEELHIELDKKSAKQLNQEFVVVRQKGLLLRNMFVLFDLEQKPVDITISRELVAYEWVKQSQSLPPEIEAAKKLLSK